MSSARGWRNGHQGRHFGAAPAHEPQPHDLERYLANYAAERSLGGLKP